ncbi:hypothetical protein AYO38_09280 [bacterium SCGC AG-212-C10]|nr:hypothetical protein AYO38_09280 [bacterium SCGC AG-212-C10]
MNERALEGLKVLDLTWVVVGPTAIRALADYGATVIKVETGTRVDTARTAGPFFDGKPGPESSACFNNANAGKLGLLLNMGVPESQVVLRKLVEWADVMAENFTPHVMRRWGLDYESVKAINPRIIYLSASMNGQHGPYSNLAAIGNVGAAIAGLTNSVGWPDRPPAGPGGAYTDYVAAKYITISLLAALEYRDNTGHGQYIDLAQAETAISFMAPSYLDYQESGRLYSPVANRSYEYAPNGVFPTKGHEQWLAISVQDDEQWQQLTDLMGRADLAADESLAHYDGRAAAHDHLTSIISAWTADKDGQEIEAALIARGVAAHVALDAEQALSDPQLAHRNHFLPVPHDQWKQVVVENARFHLERTPPEVKSAAPTFGQHNSEVLSELLGMDDEQIIELAAAGVFE